MTLVTFHNNFGMNEYPLVKICVTVNALDEQHVGH